MSLKDKLNRTVDKTATKKLPILGISLVTLLVIIGLIFWLAPKNATVNGWLLKIPFLGGWYAKMTNQQPPAAATSTGAANGN